ncbi:hypothetical protein [Ornithinimicrobium avium]|uniref:Uncharacterized protein n=1 Tax=Ornithinimicrobium avium TaxID=2283195 RepID=A0A345NRG2_9MICO|nr:hypothetical protein [Ornithinimicrobium avium]AXH97620.1 hypothetical protein DV701_17220 [Ornithinimicrobium avium]
MDETEDPIVSTTFAVEGVRSESEVREALQALYDVFSELGLGQATFEVTGSEVAQLFVKHKSSVRPDRVAIAQALSTVGARVVD